MTDNMALPPGLEFLRTPFMSAVSAPLEPGAPSIAPTFIGIGPVIQPMETRQNESTPLPGAIGPATVGRPVERSQHESASGAIGSAVPRAHMQAKSAVRKELVKQVRQEMALEIDVKWAEKLERVWAEGNENAKKQLLESRSQHEELLKQIVEFRDREAAMEAENAQLHQLLVTVLGQLALWGSGAVDTVAMDMSAFRKTPWGPLAPPKPDTKPEGSSTTASERGEGSASERLSPNLTFDMSPLTVGVPPAPASESGGSNSDVALEHPPGLPKPAAKLPEVPAFPFAQTPQVPTTPLSLSEALGLDEAPSSGAYQEVQCVHSMTAPPLTPSPAVFGAYMNCEYAPEASAFQSFPFDSAFETEAEAADGFVFSITLRKAEGCSFGLTLTEDPGKSVLQIDSVLPGGAAEAWNRQCGSSGAAEKVLLPGDIIISVNGIMGNSQDMTLQCENQLLRLMVVRRDGPRSAPPAHIPAVTERPFGSQLRSDAADFVPFSVDAPIFLPMSTYEEPYDGMDLTVC